MMLSIAPLLILTVEVVLGQGKIYSLDMANKCVDDIYYGCRKEMSDLVFTFLMKEIDENPTYKEAWEEAEENAKTPAENLNMYHSIAIYVYTSRKVYADFNNAVRYGKRSYITGLYRWYSLQFLLTEAIQILKETQKRCHLTYRRTNVEFDKSVKNKEVRFGSFTSSSLDQNVALRFGDKSCFEIETCEGADVAKYSVYPELKEVLIPPYEKFIVTDIKKRGETQDAWCKTVYVLKSSGTKSNLNCAVASVKQTFQRFFSLNWSRIFFHKFNSEMDHPLFYNRKIFSNQDKIVFTPPHHVDDHGLSPGPRAQ